MSNNPIQLKAIDTTFFTMVDTAQKPGEQELESGFLQGASFQKKRITSGQEFKVDLDGDGIQERMSFTKVGDVMKIDYSFEPNSKLLAWVNQGLPSNSSQNKVASGEKRFWDSLPTSFEAAMLYIVKQDDGRDSLYLNTRQGLFIFTNRFDPKSLANQNYPLEHQSKFIPEYERTGALHLIDEIMLDEAVSNGPIQSPEALASGFPAELIQALPKRIWMGVKPGLFLAGTRFVKVGDNLPERLEKAGFKVQKDIQGDAWPQDASESLAEPLTLGGQVFTSLPLPTREGGHVQPVRNQAGKVMLTQTVKGIVQFQKYMYNDDQKVLSYEDALEGWASFVGYPKDQIMVLPNVAEFKHADQQIAFFANGKAIAIKLPKDHPDYQIWEDAKNQIRSNGFDIVAEIELPPNLLATSRSPLNILMGKTKAGVRYEIPVDPIIIYDRNSKQWVDLRNPKEDPKKLKDFHFNPERFTNITTFYDLENLPPYILQIKAAMVAAGVPEKNIEFIPYNGAGGGSIHCRTNLDSK